MKKSLKRLIFRALLASLSSTWHICTQSTLLHELAYTNQNSIESTPSKEALEAYNERGFTAVHEAVVRVNTNMVKDLILNGADINARIKTSIPWHKNTHYDFAETAIHLAVRTKNFMLVALLIKLGADTTLTNNQNKTARMLAEELGYNRISSLFKIN